MKKTTNTTMPAIRPYMAPFDGLLMFSILLLYRNIPVTSPIEIAVVRWRIDPAKIDAETEGE
jgi:hypothetical protein